jgi:hypothetical protein
MVEIPVYIYQLKIRIGDLEAVSKIGFSDRLGLVYQYLVEKIS